MVRVTLESVQSANSLYLHFLLALYKSCCSFSITLKEGTNKISKQMKTGKLEDKGKIQHQRRIPIFTKQWKGKQASRIMMCIKVSIYKNWLPWNSSKVKFLFKLSVLRWLYSMCIPHSTRVSQLKENPNTETQTSRSLVHLILKYCPYIELPFSTKRKIVTW